MVDPKSKISFAPASSDQLGGTARHTGGLAATKASPGGSLELKLTPGGEPCSPTDDGFTPTELAVLVCFFLLADFDAKFRVMLSKLGIPAYLLGNNCGLPSVSHTIVTLSLALVGYASDRLHSYRNLGWFGRNS